MERENGYYWVKEKSSCLYEGRWVVVKWNGLFFEMFGLLVKFCIFDFEQIDERGVWRS